MDDSTATGATKISAVILSAGKSGRFGMPKAFVYFDETKTFLQKILSEYYRAGIKNIALIVNAEIYKEAKRQVCALPEDSGVQIIINLHPETGRFSSIKLAVNALCDSNYTFLQNIDNPFTTAELLQQMMALSGKGDYIVPVFQGEKGHPVLLSDKILTVINHLPGPDENLRDVLKEFTPFETEAGNERILANINTQEEYSKYFTPVSAF